MRATPPRSSHPLPPTLLQDTLLELYPSDTLTRSAEESGFIRRHRKVDPVAFFRAVVFEGEIHHQRSLEQLRYAYNLQEVRPLSSYASFYERFTPELVEFLHPGVAHALAQRRNAPGHHLSPKLDRFADVLSQDSTIVRVSAALAAVYPPVRHSAPTAGVKVATLVSVRANGPQRVELFAESVNDRDTLKVGPCSFLNVFCVEFGPSLRDKEIVRPPKGPETRFCRLGQRQEGEVLGAVKLVTVKVSLRCFLEGDSEGFRVEFPTNFDVPDDGSESCYEQDLDAGFALVPAPFRPRPVVTVERRSALFEAARKVGKRFHEWLAADGRARRSPGIPLPGHSLEKKW